MSLKPGSEAAYTAIEKDTARVCAELKCPHPHLAIESLTGPREVWWLNAFESEAEKQRVYDDYAKNRALMLALERNSKRNQAEALAVAAGSETRIFAARPYWGMPATEWIAADPEFWKSSPMASAPR